MSNENKCLILFYCRSKYYHKKTEENIHSLNDQHYISYSKKFTVWLMHVHIYVNFNLKK